MAFLAPVVGLLLGAAGVGATAVSLISVGLSLVVGLAQKKPKAVDPQAQALSVQLGESPRRAVLGKAWTAGTFMFGFNAGAKNIDEWVLYKFADHPINDFEGFLVGDDYNGFSGDGAQPAFTVGGTAHLNMYFLDGTQTTVPSAVLSAAGSKWNSDWIMKGCSGVWIQYRANPKVWVSGRPSFRFYLGGARVYDPRHDSTVTGGSGAQRVDDYSTYVYSENLVVLALNYRLGLYNGSARTHLMVGRGLSLAQALGTTGAALAQYIAAANVCDESVALKAGGSQTLYSGGLVIDANEDYDAVLQKFADGCAGDVVPRAGRLSILPGSVQTPHDGFTDDDLVSGEAIEFSAWLPEPERVNTVIATYAGLEQRGNDASVTRRVYADLEADGSSASPRPFELPLRLAAIYDNIRAQRIAEIRRRQGRLERRATVTLPARYANLEVGDWIPWTSDYCLGGDTVMFQVVREEFRIGRSKRVTLREIANAVYDWTAATDELAPGQQVPDPQDIADLTVDSFAVTAVSVGGVPAIKATWTPTTAVAARQMFIQVRDAGTTKPSTQYVDKDRIAVGEVTFTNGIGALTAMQCRARYDSDDQSRVTPWTSWADVTTDDLISGDSTKPIGDANRVLFSQFEQDTTQYGAAWDSGVTFGSFTTGTYLGHKLIKLIATMPATAGKKMVITTPLSIVMAGERLSLQMRLETQGPCSLTNAYVIYYDASGAQIGSPVAFDVETGVAYYYTSIVQGFDVAPTGAVQARMMLEYVSTAAGGSASLAMLYPMLTGASPAQTVHPAFSPGPNVSNDTATRLADVETAVTGISVSAIRISNGLYGSDTTLSGTSFITLNSAAVTGIPAGHSVTFDTAALDSGAGVGHMSAAGTILGEWDIAHVPTSGGTPVSLFGGTFSATMPALLEPTDLELTGAGNPAAVLLTYTGDVTFLLRMKRLSGPSSNTNIKGAFRGSAAP